eukprot:TRINITY_DN1728_c2_g2_i1.p1 TRINITY_DN1728_c2_g2~~TRINITY_DN1728_c2_g2_i1.p1  ORF type:complete len:611 (-),score=106.64 TRINITY_DN1728_c2_g2_i1:427-2211(-)
MSDSAPLLLLSALTLLLLSSSNALSYASSSPPTSTTTSKYPYGVVDFVSSCTNDTQGMVSDGVAALHSFWYEKADEIFKEVVERDPLCPFGYWGQALSLWKPLWGIPSEEALEVGHGLIQDAFDAIEMRAVTDREKSYIVSTARLFPAGDASYLDRVLSYSSGLLDIYSNHYQMEDEDVDACAFYCLSKIAPSLVTGKEEETIERLEAGLILELALLKHPYHPGLLHYAIHTYDTPDLAIRALPAARTYAGVAPRVPHALHMPSHIFVRLGLWEESASTNLKSMEAELAENSHSSVSIITEEYAHSLNYLSFSRIQFGVVDGLREYVNEGKREYGIDAMMQSSIVADLIRFFARLDLEIEDFEAVSKFEFHPDGYEPKYRWASLFCLFVRGLGYGRLREADSLQEIVLLFDSELELWKASEEYVEFPQRHMPVTLYSGILHALNEFLIPNTREEGIKSMHSVAALESKNAFSTPISPASDLLGWMYTLIGDHKSAFKAYTNSLSCYPNRFRSLFGAANSASKAGLPHDAMLHWIQLRALRPSNSSQIHPVFLEMYERADIEVQLSSPTFFPYHLPLTQLHVFQIHVILTSQPPL